MSSETEDLDKTFIRLITEHQGELLGYIRSVMPRIAGAEDVLQEANIAMWKQREQLRNIESFRAWAYRIAYFRTCSYIQKTRKRDHVLLEQDVMDKVAAEYEYRSEDRILNDALQSCLDKLESSDRELISMHYERHGGLKEYATSIGTSIGRLKHALIRIRSNLKLCIERKAEA